MGDASKIVDDTCGCAACCDARALRDAEGRARSLRDEVLALKAERDRYAGRVVALQAQCVELGHAVKAWKESVVPLIVDGESRLVPMDEVIKAYVSREQARNDLRALMKGSAAPARVPSLADGLAAVAIGDPTGSGAIAELRNQIQAYLDRRSPAPADAAPPKSMEPCPACLDDRNFQAVAFDGLRCMACGRQVTPEIPKAASPADFVAGELRKSTAHRPCVTVAGEDDRGVFVVTVPEARSISIDFP